MGRKRKDSNPVSLFAFQDIITSITGIMVLVVLLIILDIISHKEQNSPQEDENRKDIKTLEELAKGLETKLLEGKEWLNVNENIIRKALSIDLDALPKMIDKEEKLHLRLVAAVNIRKESNRELKSLILKTEKEKAEKGELIKKKKDEIEHLKEHIANEKLRIKDLQAKLEKAKQDAETMKKRVEIRTTDKLDKTPVFVECSGAIIKTKVINKSSAVETIQGDVKDKKLILDDFFQWLNSTRDPSEESIVLIVKPSSVGYIKDLCAILEKFGFEYNLEPMMEDKTGVY